jgi:hypothetical protein
MRESNFYSEEFEQLLREKTEQYKMYPSEKVWKGIHGSLHTKRKWFITGMSLLVTGILFFAGRELLSPSKAELAKRSAITTHSLTDPAVANDENESPSPLEALSGQHHNTAASQANKRNAPGADDRSYREINIRVSDPAKSQPDISGMLSQVVSLPAEPPSIPLIAAVRTLPASQPAGMTEDAGSASAGPIAQTSRNVIAAGNPPAAIGTSPTTDRSLAFISNSPAAAENAKDIDPPAHVARNNAPSKNNLAVTRSTTHSVKGSETLVDSTGKTASGKVVFTEAIADQQRINWLYDYAVYNMPAAAKRGRKYFQLYASPTVTYRSLSGGQPASKTAFMYGDATDYIDHKPSLGFEVGGTMMYRLTRNLTVTAGLQFNFSRNTMKAYANKPLRATTDLNSYYGYYLDSMMARYTTRNFDSKAQINLTNDFYQLSAPIGFELRIMGNERLQLNVAATIQPSYLMNTNSYLLTGDYINYVKGPSQFRRWNLYGGLETFLSYKLANGLRLQAGPEFRYQLLSSFNSGYPIQEHLKGYGLKIGIVKAIP